MSGSQASMNPQSLRPPRGNTLGGQRGALGGTQTTLGGGVSGSDSAAANYIRRASAQPNADQPPSTTLGQSAVRPSLESTFKQATDYIDHQTKALRDFSQRQSGLQRSYGSVNLGITQMYAQRAGERLSGANSEIDRLQQWQRAWKTWSTTAVPVGMTPRQFKKSLLGG